MNKSMNIVILDGYTINNEDNPWAVIKKLGNCTIYDRTPAELKIERAKNADIVLTSKCEINATTLAALPRLKYISLLATGYNNVDVNAARKQGILVSNVPAYATESVAQTVIALLLELTVKTGLYNNAIRNDEWANCQDYSFVKGPLVELSGLTMGIVGYGTIGKAVARIATAFDMRVIAYTPHLRSSSGGASVSFVSLEELFSTADVVSLNCPETKENFGFVNSALLAKMKSTAFLLNTARGGLINEADLANALIKGQLAGAGLDVIANEPMLANNPLLMAPNIIFTPHIAWTSLAARRRLIIDLHSDFKGTSSLSSLRQN